MVTKDTRGTLWIEQKIGYAMIIIENMCRVRIAETDKRGGLWLKYRIRVRYG